MFSTLQIPAVGQGRRPAAAQAATAVLAAALNAAGWWRRRRQLQALCELDDHLLRDVGLTREDVPDRRRNYHASILHCPSARRPDRLGRDRDRRPGPVQTRHHAPIVPALRRRRSATPVDGRVCGRRLALCERGWFLHGRFHPPQGDRSRPCLYGALHLAAGSDGGGSRPSLGRMGTGTSHRRRGPVPVPGVTARAGCRRLLRNRRATPG
jgi:uncharacterized protein YjiS (DUF1127 family)